MKLLTNADLTDPTIRHKVLQQVQYASGWLLSAVVFKMNLGTATQSANSDSEEPTPAAAAPHLAIDQDRAPMSFEETCTSVPLQHSPWWQVDLGSIYHITALSVNSFRDCCPEQLDGAEVHIGLKNDTNNHRCAVIAVSKGKNKYDFECEIMEARFVHVVLPGEGKTLTLCEVQVYGTVLGETHCLLFSPN
uniref:Fucolectin tachylectin-4 pentraxin-1 domain-containing protein n=1 Tax=Seriola dumerili TaxID=41447 RepID=A0A3B4UPZ1_SERDU